jgi:hypothetical protein
MSFKDSIMASPGLEAVKSMGRELRASDNLKQVWTTAAYGAWSSFFSLDPLSPYCDPTLFTCDDGRAWRTLTVVWTRYGYVGDPDVPGNQVSATHTVVIEWSIPFGGWAWTSTYSPSKDYFNFVFTTPFSPLDPPIDTGRPPTTEQDIFEPTGARFRAWMKRRGAPEDDKSFPLEDEVWTLSNEFPNKPSAVTGAVLGTEYSLKWYLDRVNWDSIPEDWSRQLDFGDLQGPGYGVGIDDTSLAAINPFIDDEPGIVLNADQGPASAQFVCYNGGVQYNDDGSIVSYQPALDDAFAWGDNVVRLDFGGPVFGPLQPIAGWQLFVLRTWIDIDPSLQFCAVDFEQTEIQYCPIADFPAPTSSTVTACDPNFIGPVMPEPPSGIRIGAIYRPGDFPCCDSP